MSNNAGIRYQPLDGGSAGIRQQLFRPDIHTRGSEGALNVDDRIGNQSRGCC
jgi:hypothetical protein